MIYVIMGSKGGIGKSSISALLAEYLIDQNKEIFCLDLDAENASFEAFEKLNARWVNSKDQETNEIDPSKFDEAISLILENKDKDIVIDTGSTTYTPFTSYLLANGVIELFKEEDIEYTIIGIVSGGGNTLDSLSSLGKICDDLKDAKLIIFNNQLFSKTEVKGKQMIETKAYKKLEDKVVSVINIPKKSGYILDNISDFAQERMLFSDLKTSEDFGMMERRRLTVYRDEIWEQLNKVEW